MDIFSTDHAFLAARTALDGLMKRQEIIGQNIANIDTPNYKAQDIDFESALKQAMRQNTGSKLALRTTSSMHNARLNGEFGRLTEIRQRTGGAAREDGNNVDIDQELSQMAEAGIRYQTLTNLVSSKFSLLKDIATRR